MTFGSTVDGKRRRWQLNTTGNTVFGNIVGGTTPLTSVTTNAGGTTHINGAGITTTGGQIYNDAVSLGANVTLTSNSSGVVTFGVDGERGVCAGGGHGGGDDVWFGGGGTTPLSSVTTDAAGTTAINGGVVTTDSFSTLMMR